MAPNSMYWLALTAAGIAAVHTLLGPDHYVPFVAISRASRWSLKKTLWITFVCGIGHVGSSVLLGFLGIELGMACSKLQWFESVRGELAGWLLIAFGMIYTIWGLRLGYRKHKHTHWHVHTDGTGHTHDHQHENEHVHLPSEEKGVIRVWALFLIFVFGPCEPLIPLVMYPAASMNYAGVLWVTIIFSMVTLASMLSIVFVLWKGASVALFARYQHFSHAFAGFAVLVCGLAIQFLGL